MRNPEVPVFFDFESGELLLPGTKARNEIYAEAATKLYVGAAVGNEVLASASEE
ncbi:hypothetical protein [Agromyces bauzanensis]|uniref:Uncharacterized protein n=1 Tax=Agromyces bauzanensis TaxID=1308924 RepID=A0A917PV13_9MICO|nr:hypothetical protein [Agromyces bauzanensis]GGJ92821.1 hypothetical protein GCM10011372_34200 [Agromyces bauzanensis]